MLQHAAAIHQQFFIVEMANQVQNWKNYAGEKSCHFNRNSVVCVNVLGNCAFICSWFVFVRIVVFHISVSSRRKRSAGSPRMLIDLFTHNARAILVSSNITFYCFRDLINDKSHALAAILFFEIFFCFSECFNRWFYIWKVICIPKLCSDNQGCWNRGGKGGYIPPIIWLYPLPIVWVWSTSASPPIIWLWCASERRCPLEFGEKVFHFWWRPFFWSPPEFGEKSVPFLVKTFFLVFT